MILIPQPAHRVRHQPPGIDRPLQRQILRRRAKRRHVFINAKLHRDVIQDRILASRVQIDAIPAAAVFPMPEAQMPHHDVIAGNAHRAVLQQNAVPRCRLARDGQFRPRDPRRNPPRQMNRPRNPEHNRAPARRNRRHPFKKRPRARGVGVRDDVNVSTPSTRRISPKPLRTGKGGDLGQNWTQPE